MRATFVLSLISLIVTSSANAENGDKTGSKIIEAVTACRSIADREARLACFDRTSATLFEARASKSIVILDHEDVVRTRRSLFGFTLPKLHLFGKGDDTDEAEIKTIESTVVSVSRFQRDLWTLKLADDSEWRTFEPTNGYDPKSGESILIKHGALGSFRASIGKRTLVGVRRIS